MQKKQKQHKKNFIDAHGQEMWDLVNAYDSKGDRSPEATNAWKLRMRHVQGLLKNEYTIYGIYQGTNLLYIGKTSINVQTRWSQHKTDTKKLRSRSAPIHHHMNKVGIEHFQMKVLEVFKTDIEAELREKYLQDTLKPQFNILRGGGGKGKLKEVRPLTLSDNFTIRGSDPDGFGFAVAKRS